MSLLNLEDKYYFTFERKVTYNISYKIKISKIIIVLI